MTERVFVERPCSNCGDLTYNDDLCRDCDLDSTMRNAECAHCGNHQWNTMATKLMGLPAHHHKADCPDVAPYPCPKCSGGVVKVVEFTTEARGAEVLCTCDGCDHAWRQAVKSAPADVATNHADENERGASR